MKQTLSLSGRIFFFFLVATTILAADRASGGSDDLGIAVQKYELPNGLRVVLSHNPSSATVAVAVTYNVGSKMEQKGRSGFAHLFEHMMFQGSANVPKGGHFKIISSHGGVFNGTTSCDLTNYFEELPAPMLEVALWLEADRMRSLLITPENFENQRAVVIEEKLQNYDNEPYGPSFLEINRLSYEGWWPYEHSVIGEMEDLENARIEWLHDFFANYYNPRNAVLSIAGSFDPDQARKLVETYFGDIPSPERVPAFNPPPFLPQRGEKYRVITDRHATLPAFHVTYHIPPMRSPAYYPLKLAAMALGDGDSSRLYRQLVKGRRAVQELYIDIDGRKETDLFSVFMVLTGKEGAAQVRKTLYDQIDSIATEGLTAGELRKVKNRIKMRYLKVLSRNLHLAMILGKYEVLWGDAAGVNGEPGRFEAVTMDEIKAAVARYLVKENRSVLDVIPAQEGEVPNSGKEGG